MIALKGRNAIILSPSRRTRQVSHQVGVLIQQVLRDVGAPIHLVQWLGTGSAREATTALMSHRHVALVLATGGKAMVQAACRQHHPDLAVAHQGSSGLHGCCRLPATAQARWARQRRAALAGSALPLDATPVVPPARTENDGVASLESDQDLEDESRHRVGCRHQAERPLPLGWRSPRSGARDRRRSVRVPM